MSFTQKAIVLGPGEGTKVPVPGTPMIHKMSGEDTGGKMSALELTLEAEGPPPHIHHNEDEMFYVLEGEVDFQIGERSVRAAAGSFLLAPRDVAHSFKMAADEPARILVMFSPGGIENLFVEVTAPPALQNKGEYVQRIKSLAPKYNLELLPPPAN